jgi:hypothetical protein
MHFETVVSPTAAWASLFVQCVKTIHAKNNWLNLDLCVFKFNHYILSYNLQQKENDFVLQWY